eukprot:scaffold1220_cov259-Pinguiococcus_pyrenoidosus.AAC.60
MLPGRALKSVVHSYLSPSSPSPQKLALFATLMPDSPAPEKEFRAPSSVCSLSCPPLASLDCVWPTRS